MQNLLFSRAVTRPRRLTALALAVSMILAGCGDAGKPVDAPRNLAACTDFYQYANAAWNAATPVPAGDQAVDISTGIVLRNQQSLLAALDLSASLDAPALAALPAGDRALIMLYRSRDQRGDVAVPTALQSELALIAGLAAPEQLAALAGRLVRRGLLLPMRLSVRPYDDQDAETPLPPADRLLLSAEQAAPQQLPFESQGAERLLAFEEHIARTLVLLGQSPAGAADDAQAAAAMEMRWRELTTDASDDKESGGESFDLPAFRLAAGLPEGLALEVAPFLPAAISTMQAAYDLAAWRGFLRWRLAASLTSYLPRAFADERKSWQGDPPPVTVEEGFVVDERIAFLSAVLPDALDRFFVDHVLPRDTAARSDEIVSSVRTSLSARVDTRDWLGAASRRDSHRTLETLQVVLPILLPGTHGTAATPPAMRADTLLANVLAAAEYEFDRRSALAAASRSGLDPMGAAWWNASARYNPISHSVVMQPVSVQLLLGLASDDAGRYAALGTTVAHEMLHAFGVPADSSFLPDQKITWIAAADRPWLDRMVERLRTDYAVWALEHYAVAVAAPRFMGEDLSDLGSVPVALDALRRVHPQASGQTFFSVFASAYRTRQTRQSDLDYLATVPAHALYPYRVNGPLSNLPEFAWTYGCVATDPMVRGAARRVSLW